MTCELSISNPDHNQPCFRLLFVDSTFETYQDYCVTLRLLAKILNDFAEASDLEDPLAQTIQKTYLFVQLKFKQKFPDVYADFQRIKAEKLEKLTKKQERPPCPECGSKNIVSNGVKTWLCKDCGRQFRKVKRI